MFISPMLLETASDPFSDSRYIFEPKIDGHRLIFTQQNGMIRLYTRHNNDCTRQYPELHLPFDDDIILDGEIACVDPVTGVSDFESVMSRFQAKRTDKIQRLTASLPVFYAIFDVLQYKGIDMRKRPLMERKELLANLQMPSSSFGVVPHIQGAGEALFEQIENRGMEGIVAKREDSLYETGRRSASWLKIINWTFVDVFITGYRKEEFGWLASVPTLNGKFQTAGIIEHGVTPTHKKAFRGVCKSIVSGEDKGFVYLEPIIQAKVKIRNWTKAGLLRSPVFVQFKI